MIRERKKGLLIIVNLRNVLLRWRSKYLPTHDDVESTNMMSNLPLHLLNFGRSTSSPQLFKLVNFGKSLPGCEIHDFFMVLRDSAWWLHNIWWRMPFGVLFVLSSIKLSSNARRVLFWYPQIYLNKKGKACKAGVNEWINIHVRNLQKSIKEVSNASVKKLFQNVQLPFWPHQLIRCFLAI